MKDFLTQFILTLVIAWIAQLFLPWWILVIIAAVVGLFFNYKYGASSFVAGFLAIGVLWLIAATWMSNGVENQLLTVKIGELFGGLSRWSLILVTAILGACLGGLGALTGAMGRKIFM